MLGQSSRILTNLTDSEKINFFFKLTWMLGQSLRISTSPTGSEINDSVSL
jgi:hypothetical protein